ncbi:hypothetical protein DFH08DRAFT_907618 [Mycena albidolilacea]|uniref:Uncharacterized protein n=1 Tax=Mycena albidolilacea TaxID=1033008 RepID=A0AAD7E7M8_9AGAR|nr:hypothetical protein DFH08DRAFT_907618 [Mycena albidolilacea]
MPVPACRSLGLPRRLFSSLSTLHGAHAAEPTWLPVRHRSTTPQLSLSRPSSHELRKKCSSTIGVASSWAGRTKDIPHLQCVESISTTTGEA